MFDVDTGMAKIPSFDFIPVYHPALLNIKIRAIILFAEVMVHVLIAGKPGLPKNFEEQTLVKLEEAICAIHNSSCISYSLEELYLAVENMCSHKMADKLYNRLTVKCENHIKQQLPKLLAYLLDKEQYGK